MDLLWIPLKVWHRRNFGLAFFSCLVLHSDSILLLFWQTCRLTWDLTVDFFPRIKKQWPQAQTKASSADRYPLAFLRLVSWRLFVFMTFNSPVKLACSWMEMISFSSWIFLDICKILIIESNEFIARRQHPYFVCPWAFFPPSASPNILCKF